jgi:hypothetical protein
MKKKLISSVISVLCCLVVMMVGVYASTTDAYQVSVANDIDVKIIAVDGTLYARRRGGVYATPPKNESAYGNAVTEAVNFEGSYYEDFEKIYDIQNNIDAMAMERLCRPSIWAGEDERGGLDINVYHNEIEYVFRYEIPEDYSLFTTKLSIVNGDEGDIKPNQSERYECSYKYHFGETEPTDWNVITTTMNIDGTNYVEVKNSNGKRVVYIRAYFKYNTEDFGEKSSEIKAEADKGLGLKGKWKFSLVLEEFEE